MLIRVESWSQTAICRSVVTKCAALISTEEGVATIDEEEDENEEFVVAYSLCDRIWIKNIDEEN